MLQACRPQWKKVARIASLAAAMVPGSAIGGAVKWVTGSATPKNIRPMPMPAENSIANQDP